MQIKNPQLIAFLDQEWRREDGHPDFAYSEKRLKGLDSMFDLSKEEEKEWLEWREEAIKRTAEFNKKMRKQKAVDIEPETHPTEHFEVSKTSIVIWLLAVFGIIVVLLIILFKL